MNINPAMPRLVLDIRKIIDIKAKLNIVDVDLLKHAITVQKFYDQY